jgi:hypothetical protein
MTRNTLTLLQEVYFDICDRLYGNSYKDLSYDNEKEFLQVQKDKLEAIERALTIKENV